LPVAKIEKPHEKTSQNGKEPYLHHSLTDFNFYYSFDRGNKGGVSIFLLDLGH
jgi:hypothetical protein